MTRKKAREVAPGDVIAGKGRVVATEGPPRHITGYGWLDEAEGRGETVVVKSDDEEVEVGDEPGR